MLILTASELRLFGVFHSAGGYAALSAGVYCLSLEKVDSLKAKRDVRKTNVETRDVL